MKRVIEIRAAEGGDDSKLFVSDLAKAYINLALRVGWTTRLVEDRQGECSIHIVGDDLTKLENENGGHRIQRVPPTERKGRVHTSTVTVAVVDPTIPQVEILDRDLKIEWYSGTGAGGQNRNKVKCSCRLTHVPTGIVRTAQTRSRENSFKLAYEDLTKAITEGHKSKSLTLINFKRKENIGSGMRGDKRRTYRFQDNKTIDHITGKSGRTTDIIAGKIDLLW